SSDGRRALTATFDGDLRVWEMPDVKSLPGMAPAEPAKPQVPVPATPPPPPAAGASSAEIYHFRGPNGKVVAAAKNLRVSEETAGSTRSTVQGDDGVIGQ